MYSWMLAVLVACGSLLSCSSPEEGGDVVVAPTEAVWSLDQFGGGSYPADLDRWVVSDSVAEAADFAGLSGAIEALASSDREIELVFANLKSIPDYAIFGDTTTHLLCDFSALVSISASVATSVGCKSFYYCDGVRSLRLPCVERIGDYAFSGCESLTSVDVPAVVELGDSAFEWCKALVELSLPSVRVVGRSALSSCGELTTLRMPLVWRLDDFSLAWNWSLSRLECATQSDAQLMSVAPKALYSTDTQSISLVVGPANASFIDGNELSVSGFTARFASIAVAE